MDQNEHFQNENISPQQLHRNNICDLGWKKKKVQTITQAQAMLV